MYDIIAITISTKYEDILKFVIPQNAKFLKKWIIITDEKDTKTIDVIKEANCDNIEVLFYNFYSNAVRKFNFNKGGGVRYGQKYVYNKLENKNSLILILDSDIYLPDNFLERVNNTVIEDNILYGSSNRLDYWSEEHFNKNKVDYYYFYSKMVLGYFQLYKFNPKYVYNDSGDCSGCDAIFKGSFKKLNIIENLVVKHLGKACVNWKGRVSHNDFKPIQPNV
jgi:hypothetical protein